MLATAEGYSNLELDLTRGRGEAATTTCEALLCELTGAEAALVVNNGAAAVLLAVAALVGPGKAWSCLGVSCLRSGVDSGSQRSFGSAELGWSRSGRRTGPG